MKVAIHQNPNIFEHYSSWSKQWIEYCIEQNIEYEVIDCYSNKIIERLREFDVLLWHFFGNVIQDMNFSRSILNVADKMGLIVFPGFNENWHFDDKISETYLLQSIDASIPTSWVFHTKHDLIKWTQKEAEFPIVAKLKSGAGSNNVKLIKNSTQLFKYANKMFGKGISPAPKFAFKAKSNFKSSKTIKDLKLRFYKLPQFLKTMTLGKQLPNEKEYVYFQEYIPNPGYDLKVVIVGDKVTFVGRNIRKDDFRASGGGDLTYDKSMISKEVLDIAFDISSKLGFSCMGYDFILDERDKKWKIVEISYGFSHTAQLNLGGYWDRTGVWYDEPLNAPKEVLENIIKGIKSKSK